MITPEKRDDAEARQALARLLGGYSVEVLARTPAPDLLCRNHVPPGTAVYVAFVRGEHPSRLVETAARLARAGFVPVPHVVARGLADRAALEDLVRRLAGEAGVRHALVLGGDLDRPAGPFHSSLQLLETGLFEAHGITHIGLATYPETHPKIARALLDQALGAKLALARQRGLEPWLVTQFCFEAQPITTHVERLRAAGIAAPIRIGIAGPADRRTLWRYALHCGIGSSIRALGSRTDTVARLLARQSPDGLIQALAAETLRNPRFAVDGIHLFTFGGVAESARWASSVLAG